MYLNEPELVILFFRGPTRRLNFSKDKNRIEYLECVSTEGVEITPFANQRYEHSKEKDPPLGGGGALVKTHEAGYV